MLASRRVSPFAQRAPCKWWGLQKSKSSLNRGNRRPLIGRFFSCSAGFRTAGHGRPGKSGRKRASELPGPSPVQTPRPLASMALPARSGRYREPDPPSRAEGCFAEHYFSHFPHSFRVAMGYKGTMGTWEQAMSDRPKAAPLELASLFPSHLAVLGTWEQKCPIPMHENRRACGSPPVPSSR